MADANLYAGRIRKPHPHHDDLPWTVARCNRLLRSISSRVAQIRRLAANFDGAASKTRGAGVASKKDLHSPAPAAARDALLPFLQSPQTQDPEWMPRVEKSSARTYGGKTQSRKRTVSTPRPEHASSGNALRTPFLRKLLKTQAGASPLCGPAFGAPLAENPRAKSRQLPVTKSTRGLDEAQHSLVGAFGGFLIGTRAFETPARTGARSFRDMCLRRVPEYIEREQAWLSEECEDPDADAAGETYTFLESLGMGAKAGFSGLREVVRAHGVRLVCGLVQEGLLTAQNVQDLLEASRAHNATAEGQAILRGWCERVAVQPQRRVGMVMFALHRQPDWSEFVLRLLAALLASGRVSPSHLERLEDLWRRLLHATVSRSARPEAMQFVEAYALAQNEEGPSIAQPGTTGRPSCSSIATLLTAVTWMQDRDEPGTSNCSLGWHLQRLGYSLCAAPGNASGLTAARPFLLGALNSICSGTGTDPETTSLSSHTLTEALDVRQERRTIDEDVEFLPEIARIVSHIDADMALEMMKAAALGLAKVSSELSAHSSRRYLEKLAVDGAMKWAETRDDVESYDWAESIADLFSTDSVCLPAMQTPASRQPARYRWEAGMCEWIQATPFSNVRRQDATDGMSVETIDDSGVCIPESEGRRQKRSRSASEAEDDFDLEERDELSMQTPELIRLRDLRAKKAKKDDRVGNEKENVQPKKQRERVIHQQQMPMALDDFSEDELGL